MDNQKWPEEFFNALIKTEFFEFQMSFIENKLWVVLVRTQDRQKFAFSLNRIKYYLKKTSPNFMVKWNVVADDFPELKDKIKKLLKEKKAEQ